MGRPPKSLLAHVLDGTFRARLRDHRELLRGPDLHLPGFAQLQHRYRSARSDPEERAVALEVERAIRLVRDEGLPEDETLGGSFDGELAELGNPGSAAHLIGFFPHFLAHPKGPLIGRPFVLEPWQERFVKELYRRDKHGNRLYQRVYLGLPRGCGKTPLAAAIGTYELVTRRDAPEVYCAAGSKEQAGIALSFARAFVEQGPLARYVTGKTVLRCRARAGELRVISAEGTLQHGRAPAAAIVDELWAFETARQRQTYVALTSALHKREDAFLLAITTAGYDKHSLLGQIYERALTWPQVSVSTDGCLTIAKDTDNGQLLYWYGAPEDADIEDERIWRNVNPASWIKTSDLKKQLHDPGLGEAQFRRLHLNQWTRARDAWLPGSTWRDLRSDHQIPERAEIYIGVDVGISHDATAVCWAHVLEDGRIALRAHVWCADPDAPAHEHAPDGRVRLEQVERFILDLAKRYRVRELAYDPRFFNRSAELLANKGFTVIEFLQASAPMRDAYQSFFQLALEGQLTHDGDPILAAHIDGTAATKTAHGWKLNKLTTKNRIDATVAAVLAVARAQHHKPGRGPQIFWMEA